MKTKIVTLLALILLLAACGGDDEDESNDVAPPEELIAAAATAIDDASAFQISIAATGSPVALNAETIGLDVPITFQRAEGAFVAPDSLGGDVTILIEDVTAEVDMIVVGPDQYLNHPLITLGNWRQITFSETFDASNLVVSENSIASALNEMSAIEYIGEEDLDGLPMHHIRGVVASERVSAVTVGLIGDEGEVALDLFIRTSDGLLEQLVITEEETDRADGAVEWTIGLFDYNGDYQIDRPEVAE